MKNTILNTFPVVIIEQTQTAAEMIEAITQKVEQSKTRSAWDRGVKAYAIELLENLAEQADGGYITREDLSSRDNLRKALLNGARDWREFSEGGCSLCYDCDIAERLCAPWELRKTRNGERNPNSRETWINVQTRALYQAARLIVSKAF